MGLDSRQRGLRWRGITVVFRAAVGGLLLRLSGAQSVSPQTATVAKFQTFTQPEYHNTELVNPGVDFLAAFVQSFIHTVQPKPFPKDLILEIIPSFEEVLSNGELRDKVLLYEVGFLVSAAIGILYIIVMPIAGLVVCCHCCCVKKYQKQTSSIQCRRRTLYWSLFITTVVILAGNVCMFRSNGNLKVSVDGTPLILDNSIENLHTFITAVPQQVHYVVNESTRTIQEVSNNLDAIGLKLGLPIQERFRGTLDPTVHSVRVLDEESASINVHLKDLNSSLAQLQSSMNVLQANFTAVKDNIDITASKPNCVGCSDISLELQKVSLDASITIPSLAEFQSAVDEVIAADFKSQINKVEDYLNSIPQTVTDDTRDVVQTSKQQLSEIEKQISQLTNDLPLNDLTNILDPLNQAQVEINNLRPEILRAEVIRSGVFIALSCIVLLVVVCNALGLVLGPLGLKPQVDPTNRSCTADCGGTFLMMGAGFSFLFSWLFMIAVLLLFVFGGNVYKLICQPWNDGQLLNLIDTPGLIPGLDIQSSLKLKTNVTITDIYNECEKNQPLWSVLHLSEVFDLGAILNVSGYTEELQQHFENTNITLSTITLLSPEIKNSLTSFTNKVDQVNFTHATQQINSISNINLNTTADKLDALANIQANNDIKEELKNEARDLRHIQTTIETTVLPLANKVNTTIENLQLFGKKINGTVGEVLTNVGVAQDFLTTNTSQLVKTESTKFLDSQLGYFTAYADWANQTITQQIGRCRPAANVVNSVEDLLCSNIVESLNAFWFSLGWCLLFFVPSIIFSVKLAKYYRKMKYTDVYDNHIVMNHIPRAQMNIT